MRTFTFYLIVVSVTSLISALPGLAQQPTPLPFDNNLSIYAGHVGTWYNYASGLNEAAEIEDAVAAFQPSETVSDEIDVWGEHQINLPEFPGGWDFFEPAEGEPMQMRLIVRDTQGRLNQATVTDWDTGETVAQLSANANGTEISGVFAVDPDTEAHKIEVTAAGGAVLFRAGNNTPTITDVIPVSVGLAFGPNRGLNHTPCPAAPLGPPWGDPTDVAGKTIGGLAQDKSGCGPQGPNDDFQNDTPQAVFQAPLYNLREGQIVRDDAANWQQQPGQVLPPAAMQLIVDKLQAVRDPYLNKPLTFEAFQLLPYSKGRAHWPMVVAGDVQAVLYYPYIGKKEKKTHVTPEVQLKAESKREDAIGQNTATDSIVASVTLSLTREERQRWQVLPPEGVGDIWGLRALKTAPPSAQPLANLTQSVIIKLVQMVNGQPQPVSGRVSVTRLEATTQPNPPGPVGPGQVDVPVEGKTVDLGKGWNWKIKVMYPGSGEETIQIPAQNPPGGGPPEVVVVVQGGGTPPPPGGGGGGGGMPPPPGGGGG